MIEVETLNPDDPLLHALRLGRQTFPGIWRFMMPPAFLELRFPDEKQADCAHCPKVCDESWRADYRCCTYHPRISNFLLGLAMQTPLGEAAVDDVIERGMLLPEGMHAAPQQWLHFLDDQHEDTFGRSEKVLCPMLDANNGLCRAHAFRNAVCSTYFCYKDQGSAGEQFWSLIQTLGTQLEMRLSQWALQKVGFDLAASLRAMNELGPKIREVSSASGWRPEALKAIWGSWWGREKELLRACAAVIAQHRDQLWEMAQTQVIAEASGFDQALTALIPEDQAELVEDPEDTWEQVDLLDMWEDCLSAHDVLWEDPSGLFTLSPCVQFLDLQLEYRFQDGRLSFYLPVSADQRALLESYAGQKLPISTQKDFLRDMVHKKVLWTVY